MRTPVVLRHDLDVTVILAAVRFAKLDAQIGEVNLIIEVREVVFPRPVPNLVSGPIGMSVVVVAVPIALVQPPLVLASDCLLYTSDAADE